MVGIVPAAAYAARPRLLAALMRVSRALPAAQPGDADGLDGLVRVGVEAPPPPGRPCLDATADERADGGRPVPVRLEPGAGLDARLGGATLTDGPAADAAPLRLTSGRRCPWPAAATTCCGPARPAGANGSRWHRVSWQPTRPAPPPGAGPVPGPCWRSCTYCAADARRWPPPPRAPRCSSTTPTSTGPATASSTTRARARRRGARLPRRMATIPLDWWFAHPRAALLREHPAALSLVFHGRPHRPRAGAGEGGGGVALAAQALRRAPAFERRSGPRCARDGAAARAARNRPCAACCPAASRRSP